MSFFKKLFSLAKKPGTPAYRLEQAKKIHGQPIKYVTEHINGNEDIVGRGGSVSVVNDQLIVDSSGERLFICPAKEVEVSWLMSGNGVVISGANQLEDGRHRSITVHFVYYRK